VIYPVQYELERAHHANRQRAAAKQRLVHEAERHARTADVTIVSRLRSGAALAAVWLTSAVIVVATMLAAAPYLGSSNPAQPSPAAPEITEVWM
jgi:hypothetical protein